MTFVIDSLTSNLEYPVLYTALGAILIVSVSSALVVGQDSRGFREAFDGLKSHFRSLLRWLELRRKKSEPINTENLVLTKHDIERIYGTETWQRRVYEDLITVLLSREYGMKTFPCVYATKGYKSNDQRYVFIDSDDPSEPRNVRRIAAALRAYLPHSKKYGPNTTLVVLCPPSEPVRSVEQYNLDFWGLLHGLRVLDTHPWPAEIPADTQTNKWAFCFDGVPWFPAALTPAHERRRSRYNPNLVYVMQPKWIFDILFNTHQKRVAACEKVRGLVTEFDEVALSPDVAHYGEPGTTESRQYFLLDENERSFCPYPHLL